MPYVEATILEVLRYKTPFPFTQRSTQEDTEVGGYVVPRGTLVYQSVYQLVNICFASPINTATAYRHDRQVVTLPITRNLAPQL